MNAVAVADTAGADLRPETRAPHGKDFRPALKTGGQGKDYAWPWRYRFNHQVGNKCGWRWHPAAKSLVIRKDSRNSFAVNVAKPVNTVKCVARSWWGRDGPTTSPRITRESGCWRCQRRPASIDRGTTRKGFSASFEDWRSGPGLCADLVMPL